MDLKQEMYLAYLAGIKKAQDMLILNNDKIDPINKITLFLDDLILINNHTAKEYAHFYCAKRYREMND